jgi:dihydroxyacetone kinase-like predicted kinase
MTKNFEAYYNLDKTGLENQYVILVDGEIVTKGEDIETMLKEVLHKYPNEIPFVAKVPDKKMLII